MKDSTNGVKDIHMLFTRSKIKGEFLCKERQERQEQCTFWPCESLFGFILLVLLEESPIQKSSEKSTLIFESKKKKIKSNIPAILRIWKVKEQFCLRPPLQALDQGWDLLQWQLS